MDYADTATPEILEYSIEPLIGGVRNLMATREEIDELAQGIALVLLAEWIAIEHNETRLESHKYMEEAQSLADWLYTIGYRLEDTTK